MYVRLAFSTAIHVNPDILIVDEALAVGDAVFANRCIRKFEELREKKITVLFVSHDLGLVKQLSHRAIFLLNGRIEAEGEPKHVIDKYIGLVLERQKAFDQNDKRSQLSSSNRHGDGSSEILEVSLLDESGRALRRGFERRTDHHPHPHRLQRPSRRAHGRNSHSQPHRHGCLRHQYEDRADRSGQVRAGRGTRDRFSPSSAG